MPTASSPGREPVDVARARQALAAERGRLVALVSALDNQGVRLETEAASTSELSASGQHPADVGTETFERERDLTILADAERELAEVEAAFDRLAEGRYGACEWCGQPIPAERLEAMPATRFCVADEQRFEAGGGRRDGAGGTWSAAVRSLARLRPEFLADDDAPPDAEADLPAEEAAMRQGRLG